MTPRCHQPYDTVAPRPHDVDPSLLHLSTRARARAFSLAFAHRVPSTLIYLPVTDKKRAKSAGSQYGKQIPHKKPVKVDEPTFQPELINKGVTAKIRENAKSKIYDQAKKAAVGWRGA